MLDTVSHCRLRDFSKSVGAIFIAGVKYQLMASTSTVPLQQFYAVEFGWESKPKTSRITIFANAYIKNKGINNEQ